MSDALNRIKVLMVASCDATKQGNRDIASNMMDIALDEIAKLEPEDIEVGFVVMADVDEAEIAGFENEIFEDEPMCDVAAGGDLRRIIAGMVGNRG